MRKLLIACDHPALHTGFATVGRAIADGLHRTGRWDVTYLGRFAPRDPADQVPYRLIDLQATDHVPMLDGTQLALQLASVLAARAVGSGPQLLLSIGSPQQHRVLLDALDETGLRRRAWVAVYVAVDHAPLPPRVRRVYDRADGIVPYTQFADRAIRTAFPDLAHRVTAPVPHGTDVELFAPPDAAARRETRERVFGVTDDATFVVAFFGRNSSHKHPELALRIFDVFARGHFARCLACGRVTVFERDPIDASVRPCVECARCGRGGVAAVASPPTRLYLHTEIPAAARGYADGAWDLERLARQLGVAPHVVTSRDLRPRHGVDGHELARRMGACDVHLLPSDAGGWELTVLETGACGVPNIITDVGGAPEYAAPFSEVVPPAIRALQPERTRALMDISAAVEALLRLAHDPARRTRLGRAGVATAERFRWSRVVRQWDTLLGTLPRGS